ncbi:MAG: hypothetical protein Q9184_002396 [Pyrenodesmia sp. 2 TL-2023]
MSVVQTRVIADGRWATRTLDIHQILARNKEEKTMPQELQTGPKPPIWGLLTKTVVRSPVIKSIIPARVRHRSKNDVVFVYEDFIEIKEIVGGERTEDDPLSDVSLDNTVIKRDFDSCILAARVFGLPRQPKVPRYPGRFWDEEYKAEASPETKPDPFREHEIPPQILVLTLASRILVFLFGYYDVHEEIHFLSSTKQLPAQIPLIEELGVHLAVDPKSRAMAVGAYETRVTFYALESMEQMREKVQSSEGLNATNFKPVRDERHLHVDGFILKMDFLHPSKGDEYHVILLLVVSKDQRTRLVRFEWDSRSPLSDLERKPGQTLPHPERLPLLLIPLTYGAAFALVCEKQIIVYRHILAGHAKSEVCNLEHYEPPEEPGASKNLPIWTQWARPMRIAEAERPHPNVDHIYLCREDGVVRFIDIREDSEPMVSSIYRAGILNANVGTAFATLDLGEESNDLIVAAGEMGDGGLWYFRPREPVDMVGTIRNWTPLRDMMSAITAHPAGDAVLNGKTGSVKPARLFACSGRGPRHGAITEIRTGTEAVKLGPAIDLGELADRGLDHMWALPDRSNFGIYLMVAHPTGTELILLPASDDLDPRVLVRSDVEELDLDVTTIAAGSTAEGFIIQVTPTSVNAIAQENGVLPFSSKLETGTITAASFLTIPMKTTILLTVVRKEHGFYLHHGQFGVHAGRIAFLELGEAIQLQSETSSVSVHWIDDRIVAFVGTLAGTLQSYTADPGSSLTPQFEYSFGRGDPSSSLICDSLALLTTPKRIKEESKYLLMCGLRNGVVDTLLYDASNADTPLSSCDSIELGHTSVKVLPDATRSSRAIAACEQVLYTFDYLAIPSGTDAAIVSPVWLTDPGNPALMQRPLTCFTQASSKIPQGYPTFGAGSLFYMAGGTLLLADLSLSPEPQMVPRRLPLNGTPTRVIYSKQLNKLVVLYTVTRVDPSSRNSSRRDRPASRRLYPTIGFIDPDAETLRSHLDDDGTPELFQITDVKPQERFLGLLEWLPTNGDDPYRILVVNTVVGQPASEQATGRLLLFSLTMDRAGKVNLNLKKGIDKEAPVWCVTSYGNNSLIYACGDDIVLQKLDMSTKHFEAPTKITLRCRATHISVSGGLLFVSTRGSGCHAIYPSEGKLQLLCAATSGRSEIYHLKAPGMPIVLSTDNECRVAGLWLNVTGELESTVQIGRTAPLLFEARGPGSITRLCEVPTPSWLGMFPKLPPSIIVGSSEDGALYQFIVVSEHSWRLLVFIQNMAMRDPRVCPYPSPLVHEQHIEPRDAGPKKQNRHINGDILERLLRQGGVTLLEEMLAKEPDPNRMFADYRSGDDRRQRFDELVDAAGWAEQDRRVERVVEAIGMMLVPVI